jgi:hypothetical protein
MRLGIFISSKVLLVILVPVLVRAACKSAMKDAVERQNQSVKV